MPNLWDIHWSFFALFAFFMAGLSIIGLEWWCWKERKALFITKDKEE